ncbi:SUR7 family protein FMP45 [Ceratocystis fimbriata CBS 114723]|uniref:SUR7 family protein FMP45 n=1 Tax=Ceratocystis fimbriata CBS 114723 TaxID=1035309 RepID=A0A2C5XHJ3_9PEZI|nr:SUR7 family protein FMP45 [Ceratocystis fimbriata CBS 114723]
MKLGVPLGVVGMTLMATSLLFLWFIILSGIANVTPFRKTYFLQADTSGITGARDTSQWTYFWICGRGNHDCGSAHGALPFGYAWDSYASDVPQGLGGSHGKHTTSHHFWYMWRFGWVFFIITLFFETIALCTSVLACCGRIGSAISSMATGIALFFYAIAVSLMTATFVQARNRFHDAGRSARLGRWSFGFAWAGFAALALAWFCFSANFFTASSQRKSRSAAKSEKRSGNPWRKRNTSALGERRAQESGVAEGRRVKDEYM